MSGPPINVNDLASEPQHPAINLTDLTGGNEEQPVQSDITRAPVGPGIASPRNPENVGFFGVLGQYLKDVAPSAAIWAPAAREIGAPGVSIALSTVPNIVHGVGRLISGIQSSDELIAERQRLLSDRSFRDNALAKMNQERLQAANVNMGGQYNPAHFGDLMMDMERRIDEARQREAQVKAYPDNPSLIQKLFEQQPEMGRADVLRNLGRDVWPVLSLFAGVPGGWVPMVGGMLHSTVQQFKVARGEAEDPNISPQQASESALETVIAGANAIGASAAGRGLREQLANSRILGARARAGAELSSAEGTPVYRYNAQAEAARARLGVIREQSGVKPPPAPIEDLAHDNGLEATTINGTTHLRDLATGELTALVPSDNPAAIRKLIESLPPKTGPDILGIPADVIAQMRADVEGEKKLLEGTKTPGIWYHGTPNTFGEFDPSKAGPDELYGPGFYHTDNPEVASGYSDKGMSLKFLTDNLETNQRAIEQWKGMVREGTVTQEQADKKIAGFQRIVDNTKSYIDAVKPNIRPARLNIKNPFNIDAVPDDKALRFFAEKLATVKGTKFSDELNDIIDFSKTNADVYTHLEENLGSTQAKVNPIVMYPDRVGWPAPKEIIRDWLREFGYDGITHVGGKIMGSAEHNVAIAFEPTQIRTPWQPEFPDVPPPTPTPPRAGEQLADGWHIPFEKPGVGLLGRILQKTWLKPIHVSRLPGMLNAIATKTGEDLSPEFFRIQESAKIADALVAQKAYELKFAQAAKISEHLTDEQLTHITEAIQTASPGERWQELTPKDREYAAAFLAWDGMKNPENPNETWRLDLNRIYKYTREYSELEDAAEKRKWTPEKLQQKKQQLTDYYQKRGFTPNNVIAAQHALRMRNEPADETSMSRVLGYVQAVQNAEPTQGEYIKSHDFTPDMLKKLNHSVEFYKTMADYLNIPEWRRIPRYATHVRNSFEEMPSELRTILIDQLQPKFDNAPGNNFWFTKTKTGEIDNYETNPLVSELRYLRAAVNYKEIRPVVDANEEAINDKINKMAEVGHRRQAVGLRDSFLRTIKGMPEPADQAVMADYNEAVTDFLKTVLGKDVKLNDRAMKNMIGWLSSNMTAAYQGGRPGVSWRDFQSAMIMAASRFDARTAIDIANRTFGKFEVDENGNPTLDTVERVRRAKAQGILGQAYSPLFKPSSPTTSNNPVVRLMEGAGWIKSLAETTSGQRFIYDAIALSGYDHFRARAIDAFNELVKAGDKDPQVVARKLNKSLFFEAFPPDFQADVIKTLNTQGVEAAAHQMGQRASMMINDTFGYGMAAVGWRSIIGTMLGRYGNYSVFAKDNLVDMMSYGSKTYRAKVLGKLLGMWAGAEVASKATGWNFNKYLWYTAVPFTGSPMVGFGMNTVKALEGLAQQGDLKSINALLDVVKEIGESQIPFYVLFSQYKRLGISDGVMNQILLMSREKGIRFGPY